MPIAWAIVVIALWVAVVFLAIVVLGVIRQLTPHLDRIASGQALAAGSPQQGPPIDGPLPEFTGRDRDGNTVTAADLRGGGGPSLLVFLHSSCGPCRVLAGELATADLGTLADGLTVVTDPRGVEELALLACLRVVLQSGDEISDALEIRATPYAIALDERGTVRAKRAVNTVAQLNALAAAASPRTVADLPDPAPAH